MVTRGSAAGGGGGVRRGRWGWAGVGVICKAASVTGAGAVGMARAAGAGLSGDGWLRKPYTVLRSASTWARKASEGPVGRAEFGVEGATLSGAVAVWPMREARVQ